MRASKGDKAICARHRPSWRARELRSAGEHGERRKAPWGSGSQNLQKHGGRELLSLASVDGGEASRAASGDAAP